MTEPEWERYPNFGRHEFVCRCGCNKADMDPIFLSALQRLRSRLGFPFVISSGYRCLEHNVRLGGGPAHPAGVAADIRVFGEQARRMVLDADEFTGIGVKQTGDPSNRFVHLDTYRGAGAPRPWIWSY